jgi:hypothetical protein
LLFPSQISDFPGLTVCLASDHIAIAVVSANRSNGWRRLATTKPSSRLQFDSQN